MITSLCSEWRYVVQFMRTLRSRSRTLTPVGRSRNGTTSGGCGTMVRFPSCTTVSLAAAWAALRLVARAAVLCASARSTGSWMPARILSALICVYQVVSVSMLANRRMKSR